MEKFLHLYRSLVNNEKIPEVVRKFVSKVGLKTYRSLFSNRHDRLTQYKQNVFGTTFVLNLDWFDYTDASYIFHPIWERKNSLFIKKHMEAGAWYVDAGANIGFFSLLFALFEKDTNVLAVDPSIRNKRSLEKNIADNQATNIHQITAALGKEKGEITFEEKLLNSGSGSISGFQGPDAVHESYLVKHTSPVLTLVDLFAEYSIDACHILKMDIQGGELDALMGGQKLLEENKIKYLIIEFNELYYGDELIALLGKHGYVPHFINNDGTIKQIEPDALVNKKDYVFTVVE